MNDSFNLKYFGSGGSTFKGLKSQPLFERPISGFLRATLLLWAQRVNPGYPTPLYVCWNGTFL